MLILNGKKLVERNVCRFLSIKLLAIFLGGVLNSCRTPNVNHSSEILVRNGESPPKGTFKTLVHLEINKRNRLIRHCTGTLICANLILTAGHCFEEFGDVESVGVSFNRLQDPRYISINDVHSSVMIHERFSKSGYYNYDVALLRLPDKKVRYIYDDITIMDFIPFSFGALPVEVTKFESAGYGATENGGNRAFQVGTITFKKYETKSLRDGFTWNSLHVRGDPKLLKFGPGIDNALPCHGDSGGPLLVYTPGKEYPTIHGVLAVGSRSLIKSFFVTKCAAANLAYYSYLHELKGWLKPKIDKLCVVPQLRH